MLLFGGLHNQYTYIFALHQVPPGWKNKDNLKYTRKNYELLKTGLNNVVLPILLIVVNNIEQVVEPESSPQSGVTMLNNIVDIIEQCGQHNIVQSCFQQPVTTYNFWLCSRTQHILSLQHVCKQQRR